jgi:hypothetical protein
VLQIAKHESLVSVQRDFRRQFQSDSPSANSIRPWYQQFQTKGYLCKGKSAGRPRVSEESVELEKQPFLRSPKKSVGHASRELEMPAVVYTKPHRVTPQKTLTISLKEILFLHYLAVEISFCNDEYYLEE